MKGAKLKQIYLWISIIILHPLYQWHETKKKPWVVLYTHIAQLMTHTTNIYIAAAVPYLAVTLQSQKVCVYHLDTAKDDTFSVRKVLG